MDKLKNKISKEISDFFIGNDYSQIRNFLSDCRKLIEMEKIKSKFPILYFYANWVAHSEIDRDVDALEKIIIGFTEITLPGSESNLKYNDYIDVVIDALNPDRLLQNIIDFIDYFKINVPAFILINKESGKEDRKKLLINIFRALEHIKIQFPPLSKKKEAIINKAKTIADSIELNKSEIKGLNVNTNYSNPVIVKSIEIDGVKNNQIFLKMEVDYQHKVIPILTSFFI